MIGCLGIRQCCRILCAAVFAAFVTPASTQPSTAYQQEVYACLTQHQQAEERCLEVVSQPCNVHTDDAQRNACLWDVRKDWLKDWKYAENRFEHQFPNSREFLWAETKFRLDGLEEACRNHIGGVATDPNKITPAACVLLGSAMLSIAYADGPLGMARHLEVFQTEVDALAACTLETANLGHGTYCIRLFREDCDARQPRDPSACARREIIQWQLVLDEVNADPQQSEVVWDEFFEISGPCLLEPLVAKCMLDHYAGLVIDAVERD